MKDTKLSGRGTIYLLHTTVYLHHFHVSIAKKDAVSNTLNSAYMYMYMQLPFTFLFD